MNLGVNRDALCPVNFWHARRLHRECTLRLRVERHRIYPHAPVWVQSPTAVPYAKDGVVG
ncbi:hypothetical protein NW848_13560 [Synechococcus sp. RC10A2]